MAKLSLLMRGAAVYVSVGAVLLILVACEKKQAFTPPPPKVTVSQPVRQNITDTLEYTGNTQAINTAQLRARVEGFLEKVLFRDGEMVKKDRLLFVIQQNTYTAKLQQAEGNVLTQKALLDHAQTELTRYTGLLGQKAAAQTDVENWRYQRDSARAAVMTAEAQRDLAKLELGYCSVTAPFTGRIDRKLVDAGNLVGSGTATVLAEITQTDPLYVYFNVSETDIAAIMRGATGNEKKPDDPGQPVQIGLVNEEGFPHAGTLDFTATSVSTSTGTLLARGVFPNPEGKMLPGQFARIRVPIGKERSAILVPKVAVSFDQLGSYVMIVNGSNTVERRGVKTGAAKNDMLVIEDGLSDNEWVIVNGLLKAIPGRPVDPVRPSPQQQPAGAGLPKSGDQG